MRPVRGAPTKKTVGGSNHNIPLVLLPLKQKKETKKRQELQPIEGVHEESEDEAQVPFLSFRPLNTPNSLLKNST